MATTKTATPHAGKSGVLRNGAKGYPAPKALAVPTDLKSEEVENVVTAVNPLIADSFALYLKTKNFHWHLASSHFRDYHLLLDEQADAIFESIDPLAERMRRIGGTTLRSITHVTDLQTINDNNEEFVAADAMIAELLRDNLQMAKAQRDAVDVCDDNHDTPTGNVLQEILDATGAYLV